METRQTLPFVSDIRTSPGTLCTIQELAALLKVPVKTIYYWVNRREIPYLKMGRHLRFDPTQVIAAFAAKTAGRHRGIQSLRNSSLKFRGADPAPRKE